MPDAAPPKPRHRRFRFSLGRFLLLSLAAPPLIVAAGRVQDWHVEHCWTCGSDFDAIETSVCGLATTTSYYSEHLSHRARIAKQLGRPCENRDRGRLWKQTRWHGFVVRVGHNGTHALTTSHLTDAERTALDQMAGDDPTLPDRYHEAAFVSDDRVVLHQVHDEMVRRAADGS